MNREALFADETRQFRVPMEANAGDTVTFRFRTGKDDADAVYIAERHGREARMEKVCSEGMFDYYEYRMTVSDNPFFYRFHVTRGDDHCYYNRLGADQDGGRQYDFCLAPGFFTPEWAKGAVIYQIFTDRFCRGDVSNDVTDGEYLYLGRPVTHVADWYEYPAALDVGRFYGGDLQGVRDKLDYIQSLGAEVIYFNPLFVSPSSHKYDTQDYDFIDPHFGKIVKDGGRPVPANATDNRDADKYRLRTASRENLEAGNQFFAELVEEIHRRGMRVLMDGVWNHCGSFNKWLDRERLYERSEGYEPGAYVSADSPYRKFFRFRDENGWPYNKSYEGWWGYETLPKLNYEDSPALYEYIMEVARKWVSPPYNADGWRLDVAADLGHSSRFNHRFWRDFRKAVKSANPDAVILAEHYGDPSPWLEGDQWDSIMNYDAFMEPLSWFLTGMEKHSDAFDPSLLGDGEVFFRSMNSAMGRMPGTSVLTSMNELSNHDHSRFMTRTNRTPGRTGTSGPEAAERGIHPGTFREAVMVQMTWPGAPAVYYGDEAGLCGWTDPDSRRTYPWGREDREMIEFHRRLIHLHKTNPALREGSFLPLLAGRQLIAYGRFCPGNRCVAAVNSSEAPRTISVPVWRIGAGDGDRLTRVMLTSETGYDAGTLDYPVEGGCVRLEMGGNSSILLVSGEKTGNR